jgi:hypothetical protein
MEVQDLSKTGNLIGFGSYFELENDRSAEAGGM